MNQMMKRIVHRIFLILIMLWLPLQGAFAVVVPPCAHEENTNNKLNSVDTPIIDDHLHIVHHEQSVSSNMASNQECEANTLCHVSCSTFITTALSNVTPPICTSYNTAIRSKSVSFISEQLQRPPLV